MEVDEEGKKEEKKEEGEKKEEEKKEEEKKEEEKKEEKKEDEKKEEDKKEEEEVPEECPAAELTDEEKKMWFRPKSSSDLTQQVLNSAFGTFSVPDKSAGFDDVVFEWQK